MKEILKEFEYLPRMTAFIQFATTPVANNLEMIISYKNFITQPLTKGMFVPTDEDGNVLEKPLADPNKEPDLELWKKLEQFQQAKERVLFEGDVMTEFNKRLIWLDCPIGGEPFVLNNSTIEDAINAGIKLKLI